MLLFLGLLLLALLWFLSVQFYTGCEDGCSGVREAIGSLRYPLAVMWIALAALALVRLFSRLRRH
jgi:hypothetical protein